MCMPARASSRVSLADSCHVIFTVQQAGPATVKNSARFDRGKNPLALRARVHAQHMNETAQHPEEVRKPNPPFGFAKTQRAFRTGHRIGT